jgi:Mrp family chromosome partitioning ATPase/capsular polysaccharide biosynthesis protein
VLAPFPESEPPLNANQFLSTLRRRWLTIVIAVVVCVGAAAVYGHVQTKTYSSSTVVAITTSANGAASSQVPLGDPLTTLNSSEVQQLAAAELKSGDIAAVFAEVTGSEDPTTGNLTITATDPDPARAQQIAAAYATAYTTFVADKVQAQIDKISAPMNVLIADKKTAQSELDAGTGTSSQDQVWASEVQSDDAQIATYQQIIEQIQFGEPYASVQTKAGLPTSPSGITTKKLLGIGALAGLLVGVSAALVREEFDTRVRTTTDTEALGDTPILAELPVDADVRSGRVSIAMVQAPQSRVAESIRELRTSLRVVLGDAPCPVVMVTSPEPGDGKSFVTANLAAAWAMSGSKVIVISADFRRPRLEEVFGIHTAGLPGLADLIKANWKSAVDEPAGAGWSDDAGGRGPSRRSVDSPDGGPPRARRDTRVAFQETFVATRLVETGIYGLQLLPVGTYRDNPAELFGSPGMRPVMEQLPLLADVVLLDTPPVLAVPDSAILGSYCQGALVVASEGRTDRGDLERTIRRLEATNCPVLGLAMNHVRRPASDAYTAYAYRQ